MKKVVDGEELEIPRHVAIILDGNGRWAKERMMPRTYGHKKGADNIEPVCRWADDLGIEYLTVYAFSTENWKRPQDEVDTLMRLFHKYLVDYLGRIMKNNMRMRIIGDKSGLSRQLQEDIADVEKTSAGNTGLQFTIALNYGSRDEMIRAMRRMVRDGCREEQIDEALFTSYLDTAQLPDPDLVIRTSGEQRISNFLLWQMAYSEFYFTPVLWPDFDREALLDAVRAYSGRNRRFGGLK